MQKEADFHRVPCITLRDETEWVELTEGGVGELAGADTERIVSMTRTARWPAGVVPDDLHGDGHAADEMAERIRRLWS